MKDDATPLKYADPEIVKGQIAVLLPPMNPVEQRLSLSVYRRLGRGDAPTKRDLVQETGLSEEIVRTFLESWPALTEIDETGRITGFRGLTLRPTDHLLDISGRSLFTWCAWDLLFLPGILVPHERAAGQTRCPVTNRKIRVTLRAFTVESVHPETALATFPLPSPDRHIREGFCCQTYFLASDNAAREWKNDHPYASFLSLSKACEIGRELNQGLAWGPVGQDRSSP